MRCIFCKKPSAASRSVEHVIPESMGNRRHYLGVGLVCDRCNNYFSHSVEGPLLSHPSMRNLRALYQVPTKKGKKLHWVGTLFETDIQVGVRLNNDRRPEFRVEKDSYVPRAKAVLDNDARLNRPTVIMFEPREMPPKREMSRFLAKAAFEALCLRFSGDRSLVDLLIDDPHYDRIREFARHGRTTKEWPYSERTI